MRISWYPVMLVLKTTSAATKDSSSNGAGAPNPLPWYKVPSSRSRKHVFIVAPSACIVGMIAKISELCNRFCMNIQQIRNILVYMQQIYCNLLHYFFFSFLFKVK